MIFKQKIPAFTLLEMLFVMVLSAIVVGIGYNTVNWASNFFFRIKNREETIMHKVNTVNILEKWFFDSKTVTSTSNQLTFYFDINDKRFIQLNDNALIIKSKTLIDTLKIVNYEIVPYNSETANNLVYKLFIQIDDKELGKTPYLFEKQYAASELMEYENTITAE